MLAWLAWTAAGILIGFGVAFLALSAVAILVPQCGIRCDDTLPEMVAVATAYGTWLATAAITSLLAWRHLADGPVPARRERSGRRPR